ncbi:MAG TPA: MG2 domain-containing protein, partial [Acidobacteriota bacterium]|nr:MG2 domain-containing protein [Acidobacteriota bacterium]
MTAFRCMLGVWFVLGLGLSVQAAEPTIQVNEAGSKATIQQQSLHLELEVESLGATEFPVILHLHLLGLAQEKLAEVKVQTSLPPGTSLVAAEITLPFDTHQARNLEKLLWSRIQYQIVASEPSTAGKLAEGVFSVSRVAQDVVRLHIQPPLQFTTWKDYQPRVLAVHPTSLKPVPGVEITADIMTDRQILTRTNTITNQDGYAELVFHFPLDLEDTNWAKLKVTGNLGKSTQTTEIQIRRSNNSSLVFTSDKTIYNPGDVVRLNWFAVDSRQKPLAGTQWAIQIKADSQVVFETQQTTSSIGQAALDWHLPESIQPGEYSIYLQEIPTHPSPQSSRPEPLQQSISIVVAPKPKFLIQIQSDQKRYLMGSAPAVIQVQASQHTGQALAGAHVLLAWEYSGSKSEWNHRLQTWEGKPVQFVEGQCDAQGQCQIQLPLDRLWIHHQTAPDQPIPLTAYVTDPQTGQVENQEIELRLEEKLIKIKVIGHPADNIEGQPVQFTILTTYADDTPAPCQIDLFHHMEFENWSFNFHYPLIKGETNQYGINRISWLPPPGPHRPGIRITITAQDSQGNRGTKTIWCRFLNKPVVRIETDRSLYQTGQPLVVTLRSNRPDLTVWLTVLNPFRAISSQLVHLVDGQTRVTFPYSPDLV